MEDPQRRGTKRQRDKRDDNEGSDDEGRPPRKRRPPIILRNYVVRPPEPVIEINLDREPFSVFDHHRHFVRQEVHDDTIRRSPIVYYPFSSKFHLMNPLENPYYEIVKDKKLPPLHKYDRPYFSPRSGSWEIDYFCTGDNPDELTQESIFRYYLFCININTKFLVVYHLNLNKFHDATMTDHFINDLAFRHRVRSIRGDADPSFAELTKIHGVKTYFSPSKYTNKNRVVDRVMRTIRDAVGLDKELLLIPDVVNQIVYFYNNTPHSAYDNMFTPTEAHFDSEIEGWYVRKQQRRLVDVLRLQRSDYLNTYTPKCILLIHLPYSKTSKKFVKRRRNFDTLAEFIRYDHGNVVCRLLKEVRPITVPVQFTKYVAPSIGQVPIPIIRMFNLNQEVDE
jgi:hypothetical protein